MKGKRLCAEYALLVRGKTASMLNRIFDCSVKVVKNVSPDPFKLTQQSGQGLADHLPCEREIAFSVKVVFFFNGLEIHFLLRSC